MNDRGVDEESAYLDAGIHHHAILFEGYLRLAMLTTPVRSTIGIKLALCVDSVCKNEEKINTNQQDEHHTLSMFSKCHQIWVN